MFMGNKCVEFPAHYKICTRCFVTQYIFIHAESPYAAFRRSYDNNTSIGTSENLLCRTESCRNGVKLNFAIFNLKI